MQWWCAMDELKQPALSRVARAATVVYHPESQHRYAIDSLENAPDWNVSRQIWWGHQIPAWFCPNGHITVAGDDARRVRRVRVDRAHAGDRRARHVVLVRALAVRDSGLAGADDRDSRTSTPATCRRPRARSSVSGRTG